MDMGLVERANDYPSRSAWSCTEAGMAKLSVRQSLSRPRPVLRCYRDDKDFLNYTKFELLDTMVQRGWELKLVQKGTKRSTLQPYVAGGAMVMHVSETHEPLPQWRMRAHLSVEDGLCEGPLEPLAREAVYRALVDPDYQLGDASRALSDRPFTSGKRRGPRAKAASRAGPAIVAPPGPVAALDDKHPTEEGSDNAEDGSETMSGDEAIEEDEDDHDDRRDDGPRRPAAPPLVPDGEPPGVRAPPPLEGVPPTQRHSVPGARPPWSAWHVVDWWPFFSTWKHPRRDSTASWQETCKMQGGGSMCLYSNGCEGCRRTWILIEVGDDPTNDDALRILRRLKLWCVAAHPMLQELRGDIDVCVGDGHKQLPRTFGYAEADSMSDDDLERLRAEVVEMFAPAALKPESAPDRRVRQRTE